MSRLTDKQLGSLYKKFGPNAILFVKGSFITCSKCGRVLISNNGYEYKDATTADMFYLMRDTVKGLEDKLAEARRPWWRKLLEKLK